MFVDSDRDWHYVADKCWKDEKCCGLFTIEGRRGGKTFRVISYQYEKVSKSYDSQGGIQSRNDSDAKKVFNKLVFGWRNLPPFFKPTDTGESNPAKQLVFDEPRKRDTKSQEKDYTESLHSWIDYANAKEGAYDGMPQLVNIQDEIGKIEQSEGIDLAERIRVVRECVMKGTEVVGKILGTTTIEEMEKRGGRQAKELWDKSTILNSESSQLPNIYGKNKALDENGFTMSGLHRYFKPSYRGMWGKDIDGQNFIDRWGYSQEDKAKAYLERRRSGKKGADLSSEKRKYPLVIKDCWVTDSKKSVFDTVKLEQQLEYNNSFVVEGKDLIRGNFTWRDGIKDTEVVWQPAENGRWFVSWLQVPELRNKKMMKFGQVAPANIDGGCFGLDPYDNKTTVDNRKSDAACYGGRRFDPMFPHETGIPILEYVERPPAPELMWEDMIMQCVFYGWDILIEKNKIGTINYFRMRGYNNYLMKRPEETISEWTKANTNIQNDEPGIAMSGEEPRMALIYAVQSFIYNKVGLIEEEGKEPYMGKMMYNRCLMQLLDFDFDRKWTEFDCMVGLGLMLLGLRVYIPKRIEDKPEQFFRVYDTRSGKPISSQQDSSKLSESNGNEYWNGMVVNIKNR